jgi:hypothetical protein
MASPLFSQLLSRIEETRKAIRAIDGEQVQSKALCDKLRTLAECYYDLRSSLLEESGEEARANQAFSLLLELSHKKPSKQKCLDTLADAKKALVAMDSALLVNLSARGGIEPIDRRVISSLSDVCPAAAAAFAQGVQDLQALERLSWRGPATELRESLRETLDALAPDKDVESAPGYKNEGNAARPTMRQKAKYILKNRDMKSAQIDHSVSVVENVDEMVSGITRSVYTRSNISTHTPTDREEVVRLHAWVRLILCELLALPLR